MRTREAPVIRLQDYAPPSYLVDTVELCIELHLQRTIVRTKLGVARPDYTDPQTPLVLDGDELELVALSVNGAETTLEEAQLSEDGLRIMSPPEAEMFTLEITTAVDADANTKLMGLYRSNGVFCTQCEAEGFRRITYFPDRPDILSTYTVRLEANRQACPVLLANGNPLESGELPDDRHYTVWHDPHPKPCYLFAVVGGDLDCLSDTFTTASGNPVDLNIYVESGKAGMATFAMDSLKRSMRWDEENYGREYDLDVFNIVAVSDFNMGAMENKGLNIFNDKYVLADENLATDTDYEHIEAIIAHEYFHNWTGNRITCRDWFQLCLKEGLTVYRDQEFSADQLSQTVQRIQQVRTLQAGQFQEDSGPLSHPVRPGKYREINNFYTATVYQKGAELVRMLATLVGPEKYREATDLYFERHDGEAATVEDFIACFADTGGLDLSQFALWYDQAGTPVVTVKESYDNQNNRYSLTLSQDTPPTPDQETKQPMVIPIRFGLLGTDGSDINPMTDSDSVRGDCIILDRQEITVRFEHVKERPVASLLRGFSAPVILRQDEPEEAALLRAQHDPDSYNRWSSLNSILLRRLSEAARLDECPEQVLRGPVLEAIHSSVLDGTADSALKAQILKPPSDADVAREIATNVDPDRVLTVRQRAILEISESLADEGLSLFRTLSRQIGGKDTAGDRALKNMLLMVLLAQHSEPIVHLALDQFRRAANMTDRLGALNALLTWVPERGDVDEAVEEYRDEFREHPLAIDKWFAMQAVLPGAVGLDRVSQLIDHPDFTLNNPNRARSLLAPFAMGNLSAFHQPSGAGYELFAQQVLAIDESNPQLAARLLTSMNSWRSLEPGRRARIRRTLSSIAETTGLSRDTSEIVDRCLK